MLSHLIRSIYANYIFEQNDNTINHELKLSARVITVILVLVLAGGLILAFTANKNSGKSETNSGSTSQPTKVITTPTTKVSVVGCYVAHLAKMCTV